MHHMVVISEDAASKAVENGSLGFLLMVDHETNGACFGDAFLDP